MKNIVRAGDAGRPSSADDILEPGCAKPALYSRCTTAPLDRWTAPLDRWPV
jgi:hypothetical protein